MTDSEPWSADQDFSPQVRVGTLVRRYGNEAVAWSAGSDAPVFLDPVAALVLEIVDGSASVADLVEDIHDVLELDRVIALQEVNRGLGICAAGGLLEHRASTTPPSKVASLFHGQVSAEVLARAVAEEMSSLDLVVGNHPLRVMCGDDDILALLREALGPCISATEAPVGFVMHVPNDRLRRYVLTDRSGVVLARTWQRDHALAILGGHLSAFDDPQRSTVRLRARALLAPGDGALLAPWPLLCVPPAAEPRLDAMGYRIVDRLALDVEPGRGMIEPTDIAWPALRTLDAGPAHTCRLPEPTEIRGLLLPETRRTGGPTKAQLVHYLAALTMANGDRAAALATAEAIAASPWIGYVSPGRSNDLYEVLARYVADMGRHGPTSPGSPKKVAGAVATGLATREIEQSYDELPYGSKAFVDSHPVQLSTTAEFFGLVTAPADKCRVLELGCGEGGNLLPVAEAYPGSEFVGIDLSSRQIELGTAAIADLGLANVELRHLDMALLDGTFGRFDYIICHGVFSWVPPDVQQRILDICRDNAAAGGVSYISYNTYPGWHFRGVLRKAMMQGAQSGTTLLESVALARESLATMVHDLDAKAAYGILLKAFAEPILDASDAYIAHEYLAPINEPLYHAEFVDRAAAAGLRWLGDQRVTANPALLGHSLLSVDPDDARRQEYNDMVSAAAFRGAVLCRADAALDPEQVPRRLKGFEVSSSLTAPKTIDLKQGVQATFTGRDVHDNAITLEADSAVLKAALKRLSRSTGSMGFAELERLVIRDLVLGEPRSSAWDIQALLTKDLQALRAFHAHEAVEFLSQPYRFTRELSARPSVSAWARREASQGTTATSRKNYQVDLGDPLRRFLVQHLDGTRTVDDLVAAVAGASARGQLTLTLTDGDVVEPGHEDLAAIRGLVQRRLAFLARNAMMVA